MFYIFVGLITGNITVITVVVSISQLLLSQELKTPDELRSEIDSASEYRKTISDEVGRVPPVEPLGFLRLLFESTRQDAQRLGGLAMSEIREPVYEEIDTNVSEVTERVDRVDALLREFDAATINDLVRHLQDIDIARQYFKTIYLQEELAILSRTLFYAGLPAVAIVMSGLFVFTAPSGASVSRTVLAIAMPAIIAIGFIPLAVLFAFIIRFATVSQRTAAMLLSVTAKPPVERPVIPWLIACHSGIPAAQRRAIESSVNTVNAPSIIDGDGISSPACPSGDRSS